MPHDHSHDDIDEEEIEIESEEGWDSEELLEPAGILNDLSLREEDSREIDLSEFFPVGQAFAISHNAARIFSDMKVGKAPTLHFAKKREIHIKKPKFQYHDILSSSKKKSGILAYFAESSIVRPSIVSLMEPLGGLPENALDIRTLDPIILVRHPDIYLLPASLGRRTKKWIRRHKRVIIHSCLAGIGLIFLLGASVGGSAYFAKNELEAGYKSLENLSKVTTITAFAEESKAAEKHFLLAKPALTIIASILDTPLYQVEIIHSAKALLDGGNSVAKSLAEAGWALQDISRDSWVQNLSELEGIFSSGSTFKVTDFLKTHENTLETINNHLSDAIDAYAKVGNVGDASMQGKFEKATEMLVFAKNAITAYISHKDAIITALGDERPMRYLVLNQNRDELRPSGGFPGSVIFMEFYKGRLSKYEKKDIYYYDWHLFPFAEEAPEDIRAFAGKLGLRDANFSLEFTDTFHTIDRLYQKAGGSSLDGLIAVNQGVVSDFLEKYGSVRIPSIGKMVDAQNFSTLMSVLVEAQIERKTSAKDILFEFMNEFEKKLLLQKDYAGYLALLQKEAKDGEVLMVSSDERVQKLANELLGTQDGWKYDSGNFIYPTISSFSANKTDRYMQRDFSIDSRAVNASGASFVYNSFVLESKHLMTINDREKIRSMLYEFDVPKEKHESLIFVEGAGRNLSWVRVVTPKGSKITGTPPIQIKTDDSHAEYTVFSFQVTTDFLGSSRIFFDYTSPLPKNGIITPNFYHQAGLTHYSVKTK